MQQATLKSYLDVWEVVHRLKNMNRNAPIEGPPGSPPDLGVLDLVWKLERALSDQSDNVTGAIFQSFPQIVALRQEFRVFAEKLDSLLDDTQSPTGPTLGRHRQELQGLIARFESLFNQAVAKWPIFISLEDPSLLVYLSPTYFLTNETHRGFFYLLPRITQSAFQDAGKCLTYGLSGAAVGLALQAVEATLRYYHYRYGGNKHDWYDMLKWLYDQDFLPEKEYCYSLLDRLRRRYRNSIAHGRAIMEVSVVEAVQIFNQCLAGTRLLAAEIPKKPNLSFELFVHPVPDFDSMVATFLFSWNPELPPVTPEAVLFRDTIDQGILMDATILDGDGKSGISLQATEDECLSKKVSKHLKLQPNYASVLKPLLDFVSARQRGEEPSRFNPDNPREADVDLADLFEGLRLKSSQDPRTILTESWVMLDNFMARPHLRVRDPNLVTELGQQEAYKVLCGEELVMLEN